MVTPSQLNHTKLSQKLERARSATGHHILYELGEGGDNPETPLPSNNLGKCDCSGFALAWVQGISREQAGKHKPWSDSIPWVNTDAVVHDATHSKQLFVSIDRPVPGCAVVYPRQPKDAEFGHCAIVASFEVDAEGKYVALTGIDCHGGHLGHTVEAIEEHDLTYFLSKAGHVFVALREDLS